MTRFADPERCPDCGSAIVPRAASCGTCGLPLHGVVAQRLFQTLTLADTLLVQLRASALPSGDAAPTSSAPVGALSETAAAPPYAGAGAPVPPAPARSRTARARTGLSAASVPQILLGLGALCVLVAALVFLAVTWSLMGIGGRTATLLLFTAASAALAWWLARRGLRAGAESLALVSLGLLTLDTFGADNAGWMGDPGTEVFLVVLGALLAGAGVAGSLTTRRTPVGALTGTQVVAGIGVLLTTSGLSDLDQGRSDADLLAAVLVAAALTSGLRRVRLDVATAIGVLGVALSWLALLGIGVARVIEHPTFTELWPGLHAWPALAAAVLAGAPVALGRVPLGARVAAASTAAAIVVGTVVAPALVDASLTGATLAVLAVLTVAGLAAWAAPRPWGLTAALTQVIGVAWVGAVGSALAVAGIERLADVARGVGDAVDRIPASAPSLPAPWLLPLCLAAVLGSAVSVTRAVGRADALLAVLSDLRVVVAGLAVVAVVTAPLLAPPVWAPVALLLATGSVFTAWWWRRPSGATLLGAAAFLTAGVVVGQYATVLSVLGLALVVAATTAVHLLARRAWVPQLAGVALAVSVAALTWSTGELGGASAAPTALVGLLLLAALGTLTHLLPRAWWSADDAVEARTGLEVGAAAAAVPLGLLGVLLAPSTTQAGWAAGFLTLAGVAVTGTALARADRRPLGWPGGLLLAAATWVRLEDLGVREPEAYTLPSALALLAVGLWQLHRRPDASTLAVLTPGLTLALLPSLLWTLAEPTGLRPLLLGLGCLALIAIGAWWQWTAPVLAGAAAGALLVLRLAAPYLSDAVPRWVLIGTAGALLIAVGVTWEQRVHEARRLRHYVAALR